MGSVRNLWMPSRPPWKFYCWVKEETLGIFFCLLLAAKVRSSCEEGPGQSALQSAYHDPQLDVTELKQHRTT